MTLQTSAISSGLIGVSSSFFCIWTLSAPLSFSMIMTVSSSNPMSMRSNGASERALTSPLRAALIILMMVLFPMPFCEWMNARGRQMSRS